MTNIVIPIGFTLAGLLVGLVYFRIMWQSMPQPGDERFRAGRFAGLALLRVVLFGGGCFGAIMMGVWPVIGYLLGFLAARTVAVRKVRAGI